MIAAIIKRQHLVWMIGILEFFIEINHRIEDIRLAQPCIDGETSLIAFFGI